MAALDFPASPTLNQTYPSPAVPGVPVYTWDGEKWTTTGGAVGSTGAADDPPLMDGTASVGSSTQWAREDHRHPSDTTRVAKTGDTMTGHLSLPTAPAAANAVRKDYVDAADATLQAAIAALPAPPVAATAAEYLANSAPTKMLTPGAVWSAAATIGLTDAASVAPNFSLGLDFYWSIGAAGRTLANPTNATKQGQKGTIRLINGSGTVTTYGPAYKFAGGTKPSSTVGQYDIISYFVVDASNIYCTFNGNFA